MLTTVLPRARACAIRLRRTEGAKKMETLSIECVLLLQNVFSYYRGSQEDENAAQRLDAPQSERVSPCMM